MAPRGPWPLTRFDFLMCFAVSEFHRGEFRLCEDLWHSELAFFGADRDHLSPTGGKVVCFASDWFREFIR